jgi:hypothetical protein
METDSVIEHSLPGLVYIDGDALLIGRDDHTSCLDTSTWVTGTDDSSRVSAQEDTTAHTGYNVIQMGVAVGDGVQWHTGVSVAQWTVGSSVPYLWRRVLLGIPWFTLAARGMR